ncbi:hypothetical protein AK88_05198 [Plasmodium fragile]|uniref:AP2/ERF domain-containing protein n=1 Tax=Plasmodium fragile TaxID=5857 RepID=A0A0D9QDQ6_PLAFR|nr:uncharacterized protein AK88_05198 [Plasmodium fragile]KJP85180.1 hypothetical protein AK88_05198 [Plasmodium fragile]
MDEVANTDQTFNPVVMPLDRKVATNDGSNKVSNNFNAATSPPSMMGAMGSIMGSGFAGNMNGAVGNPMSSAFVGPMKNNMMNSVGTPRTSSLNSMCNVLGKGNMNKSGSNSSSTNMRPMKGSPSNDPSILANNLVNTVVNTVVNTMSNGNHGVGNLANSPVMNGSNKPPTKGSAQSGTGEVIKKKVGRPKGTTSANKGIKKEEKVSTSSSGYPGVSWNKRMCAWLAFFYDGASRRSRTFHPKHFNMDKEKARLSAVEFMKSLENNGRKKSTKNKTGKGKTKQLNEEMVPRMLSNDIANNLNNRAAPNGTPIPMQFMPMNRGFYMQNMNRNFNLTGMSPNDRNSMNNAYNSLSNSSNLGGMAQGMQDPSGMYLHNGGGPPNMFGGNMHMLSSVKSNVNGTGCATGNSHNACNNGGSNGGGPGGNGNNMLYLNDLMFHSNLMQGGVGGGAGNGVSEFLKMEENLGLHNKDVEHLMNALFRQNYNMNMGMPHMDKHTYLHSSNGKNNGTGPGGMKASSNSANGVNNPIGNSNLANSNTAANSINGNASQGAHLYLPNHGAGDMFENANDSSNGVSMASMTMNSMANMLNLPNMGNLPNYYDYNFDPYRGNISPHVIDMMHRLNKDMKDDCKNGAGVGIAGVDGRIDDMNELNFCSTDNASWINQLKHSQNNLCNNLNSNPCDLCDTSSASPEPNMAKKMHMGNRKKAANNNVLSMSNTKSEMVDPGATSTSHHVNGDGSSAGANGGDNTNGNSGSANFEMNGTNAPCDCAPHLRNQKKHYCMYYNRANSNATNDDSYNFMAPWNGSGNPNSSNNRMNGLDNNNNENSIDSSHLAGNGSSNNNALNMGHPNSSNSSSVVLGMSTNNNQINSLAQNATHMAGNVEMNPKQSSPHSPAPFSGAPNIQDMQKQLHFQTQSGMGASAQDLHNALQMAKQTNNFAQKGLVNSNSNGGGTNNNVSGGSSNIGGLNNSISPTSNGTSAHKKRGQQDSRKAALLPPHAAAPLTEAGSSHGMNTQPAQNGKKNGMNVNLSEHNNLCSKLNSIINFEWFSSDTKAHQNKNKQSTFENGET